MTTLRPCVGFSFVNGIKTSLVPFSFYNESFSVTEYATIITF